jgi:hypothetical protein
MALGDPQQDEMENPPINIVSPGDTNMDFSTMRFAPMEYLGMAKDALMNMLSPSEAQADTIPAQSGSQPHEAVIAAATHEPSPESKPLISAIDNNLADKKFLRPVEDIRKGIQLGDEKMVKKGHTALTNLILGDQSFGEWYSDTFARGQSLVRARQMAGDVVMKEIAEATGLGMPRVEEATRLGLIKPEELLPGTQAQIIPGATTPGYTGFTPEMQPIAAPQQAPVTKPVAGAYLTPFQESIVSSRQKAIQSGLAYKAALAGSRADLADERALSERAKRENLLPEQVKDIQSKRASRLYLDALHEAQVGLTEARTEWYKQLPGLRRELSGGTTPLEIESLKRVQAAIKEKKPIEKADWLIADRWLRKGLPPYMMDFMGRGFNRFTGQKESKGQPFGWLGLPEPPSTTEEDTAAVSEIDDDLTHQFSTFLGSLLQGITSKETEAKPEAKPETGLSAAEKSELEQLRKKHGRK